MTKMEGSKIMVIKGGARGKCKGNANHDGTQLLRTRFKDVRAVVVNGMSSS